MGYRIRARASFNANLNLMPIRTRWAFACFGFTFVAKIFVVMLMFSGYTTAGLVLLGLAFASLLACMGLAISEMFRGEAHEELV